jgi:quercetin dioxygenase-like cupin family protein
MELELITWDESGSPVERLVRQRLEGEGFDVTLWHDEPGAAYHPHSHDHDELLWVVFGEMSFQVDGRDYLLRTGDRLTLPAHTLHTARSGSRGATYLIAQKKG